MIHPKPRWRVVLNVVTSAVDAGGEMSSRCIRDADFPIYCVEPSDVEFLFWLEAIRRQYAAYLCELYAPAPQIGACFTSWKNVNA